MTKKDKNLSTCALIPSLVQENGKNRVYRNFLCVPKNSFELCTEQDWYPPESMDSSCIPELLFWNTFILSSCAVNRNIHGEVVKLTTA